MIFNYDDQHAGSNDNDRSNNRLQGHGFMKHEDPDKKIEDRENHAQQGTDRNRCVAIAFGHQELGRGRGLPDAPVDQGYCICKIKVLFYNLIVFLCKGDIFDEHNFR